MTRHARLKNTTRLTMMVMASILGAVFNLAHPVNAQEDEFSLQVLPSPMVEMLDPGQSKTVDVIIHNAGRSTENLDITIGSFDIDKDSGEIKLDDATKPEIAAWTRFDAPNFTVESGQSFTEHVTFDVPKEVGFSYHFTLSVKRHDGTKIIKSGRQISGVVSIFGLVNINRLDANRGLEVVKFASLKKVYEFLPVELNAVIKNTGNTIVRPTGNIFIQRNSNSNQPIAVLDVNPSHGYILPGGERNMMPYLKDGFPVYEADDIANKKTLKWDWNKFSHFRIGKYTAKLVAIYNDGRRDVPVMAETTFWVIPWRIILAAIVVLGLIFAGLYSVLKLLFRILIKNKKHKGLR